jgi:transposase
MGDVRDVADGKRLRRSEQQKISQWGHGTMRRCIGYKAEAAGIIGHKQEQCAHEGGAEAARSHTR